MRVYSISGCESAKNSVNKQYHLNFTSSPVTVKSNVYQISFGHRNINQIAEFSPECTGNGLPEMSQRDIPIFYLILYYF